VNFWKVILATVVIFGTGVFTGGLLVNTVQHHPKKARPSPPAPADTHPQVGGPSQPRLPEILRKEFVQQLDSALQLTPEQSDAIHKIIADGQRRNSEVWSNAIPLMHQIMIETRQHIREQLTPEQQKQFEDLMKHAPRRSSSTNAPPVSLSATNVQPVAATNK
jgi:Spy/CpxP family protein refolding chaperone